LPPFKDAPSASSQVLCFCYFFFFILVALRRPPPPPMAISSGPLFPPLAWFTFSPFRFLPPPRPLPRFPQGNGTRMGQVLGLWLWLYVVWLPLLTSLIPILRHPSLLFCIAHHFSYPVQFFSFFLRVPGWLKPICLPNHSCPFPRTPVSTTPSTSPASPFLGFVAYLSLRRHNFRTPKNGSV